MQVIHAMNILGLILWDSVGCHIVYFIMIDRSIFQNEAIEQVQVFATYPNANGNPKYLPILKN